VKEETLAHKGLLRQKQTNTSQKPALSGSIGYEVNKEFSLFQWKPKGHYNAHTGVQK